jgi:hypothetical protein
MPAGSLRRGRPLGVALLLIALGAWALPPPARTTIAAQASVALGRRPEWLQAALGGPRPQVERLLAATPDDVALQIGGATLPPVKMELAEPDADASTWPSDDSREVLARLDAVARRFPTDAAARAHQLRHMTPGAVWIERPEAGEGKSPQSRPAARAAGNQPRPEALRRFALAAAAGERLEPANGFFDAMRAAGEFSARRDEEALRFLHAAATKPTWNDYAVEETRARWKLLEAAYRDHGALQKLPASWELLFPHLALLRASARMSVWHAERREQTGDEAGARAIRGDVMRLGVRMTDGSPMVIGKLVGIAIFQIGVSPPPPPPGQPPPSGSREAREKAARERYLARLARSGQTAEAAWVRDRVERLDATRAQISRAAELSAHLVCLLRFQSAWIIGLVLLEQIGVMLLLWGAAFLLAWSCTIGSAAMPPARTQWLIVYTMLFLASCLLAVSIGSLRLVEAGEGVGLALVGAVAVARWIGRRARAKNPGSDPPDRNEYAWQPARVGLITLLPSMALLALGYWAIRRGFGWGDGIDPFAPLYNTPDWEASHFERIVPLLAVLPAALLVFFVLCRVAILELPPVVGLAGGVRRVASYAIALLVAVYLGSLVSTVAADRALETYLEQTTTDELRAMAQRTQ